MKKSNVGLDFIIENFSLLLLYVLSATLMIIVQINVSLDDILTDGFFVPCLADYLIIPISRKGFYFIISPLLLIFIVQRTKSLLRINIVTRNINLRVVWKRQVVEQVFVAAFSAFYFQIVALTMGIFSSTVVINFDDTNSFFSFATHGRVLTDASFLAVLITSTLFIFLFILFIELIVLFTYWVAKKFSICLIVVLLFAFLDLNGLGIFSLAGVEHIKWLAYRYYGIAIFGVLILILYHLGLYFSKFKEFLNEK